MSEKIDLIVAAYNDIKRGSEVIKALDQMQKNDSLQFISAVVLEKDVTGETTITNTLEAKQKRGTRLGALAGGLLMVLAPPVGVAGVLVGALAGAAVGRRASKKSEHDISGQFMDIVLKNMRGDSSAIVLLVHHEESSRAEKQLAAYGGSIARHELTPEELAHLVEQAEQKEVEEETAVATTPNEQNEQNEQTQAKVTKIKALLQEGTRGEGPQFNTVHVVINPASGQDQTILNTLNTVFRTAGLKWDVSITHAAGDATRQAAAAAASGVDIVAIYGGDGAVMEAATGLIDTDVPLAILPGGTNNVVSVELGVSKDLVEAAALVGGAPSKLRTVDMGKTNDHHFILRVGLGYEAVINEGADRQMKDRYGGFAYSIAGLKALKNPPIANYHMVLDGEEVEMEGLWCMVANSASLGIPGVNLVYDIDVGDGLLDVIMVRKADLDSLVSVAASVTHTDRVGKPLPHWQVREAIINADPPQLVTGDGEMWNPTPLTATVIPGAVQILVPA